jgi:hypothetical protein
MPEEYKKGYREGFEEGFKAAQRLLEKGIMPHQINPSPLDFCGCQVCGMSWKDGPMGYVCNRSDCPTGITCFASRTEVGRTFT